MISNQFFLFDAVIAKGDEMETMIYSDVNKLFYNISLITNIVISMRKHNRGCVHFMLSFVVHLMSMYFNREYFLLLKQDKTYAMDSCLTIYCVYTA